MKDIIKINKETFFELLNSHSQMAQNEYRNNSSYSQSHYSNKVEEKIIEILQEQECMQEYFDYAKSHVLEYLGL